MRAGIGNDRLVVCLSEYLPLRIVYPVFKIKGAPCTFWKQGAYILKPVHPACALILKNSKWDIVVSKTKINGRVHHLFGLCTRQVHRLKP